MYIAIILFTIITIVLWIEVKNIIRKKKIVTKENIKINDAIEINKGNIEMEDIFYSEVKNGEKIYKIMEIFKELDVMFLKSLFQSEQIPYFFESVMEDGSTRTGFYILEKDYCDAIKIIEEYKKKIENINGIVLKYK
jgi:hypothetical protein